MEIIYILLLSLFLIGIIAICVAAATNKRWRKNAQEAVVQQELAASTKLREAAAQLAKINESLATAQEALKVTREREEHLRAEANKDINYYKSLKLKDVDSQIQDWTRSAQEAASFNTKLFQQDQERRQTELVSQTSILSSELEQLVLEIEDYKKQRQVINEEIQRSRAIKENQAFYQIQLDDAAKHDIGLLYSIRSQFSKFDILDKIIYDNYIKSPAEEMIKRVTNGKEISGIYKITRLATGEVYVGRSVNILNRWRQHTKSCYHCGTISHSMLHTTMEKDGIENFTWEILEEVPKAQLSEREAYWIKFYDSKNYGLNEREG